MKVMNLKSWSVAMGAGLLATAAALPQARGELVYENDSAEMNENTQSGQVEDRSNMRQAIGTSQKMQVSIEAGAAPSAAPVEPEVQSQYRHELMRRERAREEIKNEDLLQARLEELRLRDEKKRLERMFGATSEPGAERPAAQVAAPAPLKEEVVMAPVTEHPGQPVPSASYPAVSDSISASRASGVSSLTTSEAGAGERAMISVAPRAGFSSMVGQSGYFDVRPRFAAGVAAQLSANENFSFELGYTYNEYGVAMASSNPWVAALQAQAMYAGAGSSFESVAMKQNVVDAGLKVHLLGTESKLRPFLGGGGAYSKSYINFDQRVLSLMNAAYGRNVSPDYDVSSFLGYVATGLDVKVAKNISVGGELKYYAVLSARESQSFSNYYGAMVGGYHGGDPAVAGGTLARSSFYSILGNVTFSF